ncbi:hypothetical protein FRB95_006675 [Tulasnella sp. JGI-2019a]|nr:hypothetical protein FRB93_007822 [Tulasnella sp. JGI-2019a]KAG9037121.1 hypothetical protein FRB95_006675 [Tulasnella sp. JGI-2019a]
MSSQAPKAETNPVDTVKMPLALPAPEPKSASSSDAAEVLNLGTTFKFDKLGPLVVNSDGTLSRISNWENLSDIERERTFRILNARNKIRLANEEQKLKDESVEADPDR